MAVQDTLTDLYHNLEDKAWNAADFLEDRGVPIASFCESKGINPLILFLVALIAVVVLLSVMGGAGGPSGNAVLIVTVVDENGDAVPTTTVAIKTSEGKSIPSQRTDQSGKVTFEDLPYASLTVSVDSEKYSGQQTVTLSEQRSSMTLSATTAKGTITIYARDEEGASVATGTVEIKKLLSGDIVETVLLDGSPSYDVEVPLDVYRVVLKSTSGGEIDSKTADVMGDEPVEIAYEVSEERIRSATVNVIVKDENANLLPEITVNLHNARNDMTIATTTTDSTGVASFADIAYQTQVYPTAYKVGDMKYGSIETYEAKEKYNINVQDAVEDIEVVLPLNGQVAVVVWDKSTSARISGASVLIKDTAGEVLSSTKQTGAEGTATFSGFEQNTEIYPAVTAPGYLPFDDPSAARPISYSNINRFQASLEKDSAAQSSEIVVNVLDATYAEPVEGLSAVLSESGGALVNKLVDSDEIVFSAVTNTLYDLSIYKEGYLRVVLEEVLAGTREAELEPSSPASSGAVSICTYVFDLGVRSPAAAQVELRLSTGALIDTDNTLSGDGANCVLFEDVPKEWEVYAVARVDGLEEIRSEATRMVAREDGLIDLELVFGALPPNALVTGDVRVCVSDSKNNAVVGAEVLLYDLVVDAPSWDGDHRITTDSDGCALFEAIPAMKTSDDGTVEPLQVYPIVSSSDHATYNGKAEGNTVAVQPQRTTPINVRLGESDTICIAVMSNGQPVANAMVSLCANAPCSQMIETKRTEDDGHAIFESDIQTIRAKIVSVTNAMRAERIMSFDVSEVSEGRCAQVEMAPTDIYVSISLDGTYGTITMPPDTPGELRFVARVNDVPASGGASSSSGQSMIMGPSGERVAIDMEGDVQFSSVVAIELEEGLYAVPFLSPAQEGNYRLTVSADVPECESCRGDERSVTIQVDDGDSDDDGVADDEDRCPRSAEGAVVDERGCAIVETTSSETDSDGDGIPDQYDAYPNDPNRQYPAEDANSNGVPDAYDNPQTYQNSIQVCVEGTSGEPVYANTIKLYNTGTQTGSGSYASSGAYGAYGGGQYGAGYGQPWSVTYADDNCKTFVGYSSTQSLSAASMLSSFHIVVSGGENYEDYDSRASGSSSIDFGMAGPGGMIRVIIKLKPKAGARSAANYIRPARAVEYVGETWKENQELPHPIVYPVVTDHTRDMDFTITYDVGAEAAKEYSYSVNYKIVGNPCYEVTVNRDGLSGRTIEVPRGRQIVEDYLTVYSNEACWARNDPNLERDFDLTLEGKLIRIGDAEAKVTSQFASQKVRIRPLVGATEQIATISDLTRLQDRLKLRYGVATVGSDLPYCITRNSNTGMTRLRDARGADQEDVAAYKIVLDFTKKTDQTSYEGLITKIRDLIRDQTSKAPLDCKLYFTVDDTYMGYVSAWQEGMTCRDAQIRVPELSQPIDIWEYVFCSAVREVIQDGKIKLPNSSYSIYIDTA